MIERKAGINVSQPFLLPNVQASKPTQNAKKAGILNYPSLYYSRVYDSFIIIKQSKDEDKWDIKN